MPLPKIKVTKSKTDAGAFKRKDIGLKIEGKNKTREISFTKVKQAPGVKQGANTSSLKASTTDKKSGVKTGVEARRVSQGGIKQSSLSMSGKNKDVYMSRTKDKSMKGGAMRTSSYSKNKK